VIIAAVRGKFVVMGNVVMGVGVVVLVLAKFVVIISPVQVFV
jgi:hypothetical protein